jgi:hypothetical protein
VVQLHGQLRAIYSAGVIYEEGSGELSEIDGLERYFECGNYFEALADLPTTILTQSWLLKPLQHW